LIVYGYVGELTGLDGYVDWMVTVVCWWLRVFY